MFLDPLQLAALTAVLRMGSFDAAAAALRVTPSAVSQRIKALEERVGSTLVHRSQPARATKTGARIAKFAQDVALLEAQALGQTGLAPGGPAQLTLAVPADSLATWLIPALSATEGLLYDLRIDDQDTSALWLSRGTVSAAVTGTAKSIPGCDSVALGALRYIPTASSAFMDSYFARGVTATALQQAPMLTFSPKDQLQHRWLKQNFGNIPSPPTHQVPSTHGFIDAARSGLAWGMNPETLVAADLAAGTLKPLVPMAYLDVPLYWQTTRAMAAALAPLTKNIVSTARHTLHPAT